MLVGDHLPELQKRVNVVRCQQERPNLGTDLVAALTDLQVHDLTHD